MDLLKCLNSYGNFSSQAFYIQVVNKIPSIFAYSLDKRKIDINKFDENTIKDVFPNASYYWIIATQSEITNSAVDEVVRDDEDEDDDDVYIDSSFHDLGINVFEDDVLYSITQNQIKCFFVCLLDDLKVKIKELFNKLPLVEEKPKEAEVKLVAYDGQGYYTITSKVKECNVNLKKNYNDDFLPVHEDIIKFIDQRESGLIILSGEVGTGKSWYIRHLLSQHPKEYIIVTNAIAAHLANPEFVAFMLEHKNSIFILEDCEQILMDRSENTFGGAIANILNMSDGLMSDIFNVKFICTFNADINKIDSALLRKGRCYARYKFGKLTVDKVKQFCESHKIELPEYKEMTLGEIYNHEVSDDYKNEKKSQKRIGF